MRQIRTVDTEIEVYDPEEIITLFDAADEQIPNMIEEKRVEVMNKLHDSIRTFGTRASYTIGKLIARQEEVIKINYDSWRKMKTSEKGSIPPPDSLRDWWLRNKTRLYFGYNQAMIYKRIAADVDPRIAKELDMSKIQAIKSAPLPVEKKEKLYHEAIDKSWTLKKTQEAVEEVKKIEHRKEENFKDKKKADKNIKISIATKNKALLLFFEDNEIRDAANQIIQDLLPSIKLKIKNLLQ